MKTKSDIQNHESVREIHKDYDGWWIYLNDGWISTYTRCQTIAEPTIKDCISQMDYVIKKPKP